MAQLTSRLGEELFIALGRLASRLPQIRGKTRLLLEFFRLLRLQHRHVTVRTQLRHPIDYFAELDLHAWLQRIAFLTGGYEADTVEFLLKLYAASGQRGYLLDVGANVGLISVPFALSVGNAGTTAVAVEAVSDNVVALQKNVKLNQLDSSVRILPFGLGNRAATVYIQVEGDLREGEGSGTANILPDGSNYECVRQRLEIRTLDELIAEKLLPTGCSVIKIDTDGYDLKVLEGGQRFLARERPVIFGEFSAHCMRWHGQSLSDVLAFADSRGYKTFTRVEKTWTFGKAVAGSPSAKTFCSFQKSK